MTSTQGAFARAQADWAAHGIPTFPVTGDKLPAIKGYMRIGLPGSAALARKFKDAPALGFIAGARSRVTVLDVDTTDERVLEDARVRHGASNFIVKTGSGKFHAYYRHNGEPRRIRPWPGLPIDIIGGGMAIAPPSQVAKGTYEIIHGTLDDLDRLTCAKGLIEEQVRQPEPSRGADSAGLVQEGLRNTQTWRFCMRKAKRCGDLDTLIDKARTFNRQCCPPLTDAEVVKCATSAWGYTERGMNMFGGHGVVFSTELYNELLDDQDALILLGFLRANNLPWAKFFCTNTLAERFDWRVQRLAAARRRLVELGHLTQVKQAWRGSPAEFEFPRIQRSA
jgi:hypothetical protein